MNGNPSGEIMRKTSDLVNEMLKEAKGAVVVAIAVGFADDTRFVFSSQRQPLAELNALINKGGSPVGLLRFDREDSQIQGSFRPFEEYANEAWAQDYLKGLLDHTEDILRLSHQMNDAPGAY